MPYKLLTHRGREFSFADDAKVPYFDIASLSVQSCDVTDVCGKCIMLPTPKESENPIQFRLNREWCHKLGWLYAQIYALGFPEKDYCYVLLPTPEMKKRFEVVVHEFFHEAITKDVNRLLHLEELYRTENHFEAVYLECGRLFDELQDFKIDPRKSIDYDKFIETPIEFREGFFAGIFDSRGKILKFKRKKEGTIYYEIPLFAKYSHDIYYVFEALSSIDVNISFCRKIDDGNPVAEIFIDPMEFTRRKNIFDICVNEKLKEKMTIIDNKDRQQDRLNIVPYSREIYNEIIELRQKELHYWRPEWSNKINRKMAIKQLEAVGDNLPSSGKLYEWSKLIMDQSNKFEFYTKPVKIYGS